MEKDRIVETVGGGRLMPTKAMRTDRKRRLKSGLEGNVRSTRAFFTDGSGRYDMELWTF